MADRVDFDLSELTGLRVGLAGAGVAVGLGAGRVVNRGIQGVVAHAKTHQRYVDTGATRDSIHASGPGGSPLTATSLEAEAGPTTHYAVYLHDGTSRIEPDPFMDNALDHETPGILAAVAGLADLL